MYYDSQPHTKYGIANRSRFKIAVSATIQQMAPYIICRWLTYSVGD